MQNTPRAHHFLMRQGERLSDGRHANPEPFAACTLVRAAFAISKVSVSYNSKKRNASLNGPPLPAGGSGFHLEPFTIVENQSVVGYFFSALGQQPGRPHKIFVCLLLLV